MSWLSMQGWKQRDAGTRTRHRLMAAGRAIVSSTSEPSVAGGRGRVAQGSLRSLSTSKMFEEIVWTELTGEDRLLKSPVPVFARSVLDYSRGHRAVSDVAKTTHLMCVGNEGGSMGRRTRVTPESSDWLSTKEAARLCGLTVTTLCDWAKLGLIPEQYLIVTPGGYLLHRAFAARPQPLLIAPAAAAKCE